MIYVDRERTENGELIRPSEQWFREARQQAELCEQDADHKVTDHYKHDDMKMAVEKLFYGKCAYCETLLGVGGSWDVEHYRPKRRVAECPNHPGYYWLAYQWENLLPSCTFCNQKRTDPPLYDNRCRQPAQGKADQFPLENERTRAMSPLDDLAQERPLLLNPCVDHPERYLKYDIQGEISSIDPADCRGSETIRICNLNRTRLQNQRRKIIVRMSKLSLNLRLAREQNNVLLEEAMLEMIEEFVAPQAAYAGAAREVRNDPSAFPVP